MDIGKYIDPNGNEIEIEIYECYNGWFAVCHITDETIVKGRTRRDLGFNLINAGFQYKG